MATKKLFFVTGNKGGVGKTPVSIFLIDHLLRLGVDRSAICVVDGEAAEKQATLTRIIKTSFPSDPVYGIELSREQGYEELVSMLIDSPCSFCIADTGAGLMGELERNLAFLSAFQNNEFNVIPQVVFVAGPTPESTAAARSFLSANKETNIKTDFVLLAPPVENRTQLTINDFDIYKSEDILTITKKLNFNIHFIPTFRQDFFDMIETKGILPFIALGEKSILNVAAKIRFKQFLNNNIDNVVDSIIKLEIEQENENQ